MNSQTERFSVLAGVMVGASAIVAVSSPSATAATLSLSSLSQLYVFGDSLVDDGNVFAFTQGTYPASPPYFQGRLSNGPVWVEQLATLLGLPPNPPTNFAVGGSSTGLGNAVFPAVPLPGTLAQVLSFAQATPQADPNGLYILSAGGDDYLFGGVTAPTQPLQDITTAVSTLLSIGAKTVLVANLPNLGEIPATLTTPLSGALNALTTLHNGGLAQRLASLEAQFDAHVLLLDQNAAFNRVLANPPSFGLTNVTTPCLTSTGICSNPNQFLFWDTIHPTAIGHQLLAEDAFSTLQTAAAVPEPSGVAGAIGFTVFSLGWWVRQRRREASKLREIQAFWSENSLP